MKLWWNILYHLRNISPRTEYYKLLTHYYYSNKSVIVKFGFSRIFSLKNKQGKKVDSSIIKNIYINATRIVIYFLTENTSSPWINNLWWTKNFELRKIQQRTMVHAKWIAWSHTKNRRDFMRYQVLRWECALFQQFRVPAVEIVNNRGAHRFLLKSVSIKILDFRAKFLKVLCTKIEINSVTLLQLQTSIV